MNLDDLQTEFQVRMATVQQPNHAYIRITNLSDKTSDAIFQEGAPVTIYAGYHEGPYGEIFAGETREMRRGKMNGVDKYHDILAVDSHAAYAYAEVHKTLDKGSSIKDVIQEAAKAMEQQGVQIGDLSQIKDVKLHKAITMNGMARDILRWATESIDASWSIFNGKLQIVPNDGSAKGSYTINGDSGMVGMPEQTLTGVNIRILMNPNIKMDQMVQVDSKSIQQYMRKSASHGDLPTLKGVVPGIAVDGEYKVIRIDHDGSVQGQEWYTTLTCLAPGKEGQSGPGAKGISPKRGVTEVEQGTGSTGL